MCTVRQLEQALQENNIKRDKNLDDKLNSLREDLFAHVSKTMNHLHSSPETRNILDEIKINCSKTTQKYNLTQQAMQDDLKHIRQYMAEDKAWKKEFSQSVIDRLKEKADKDEVNEMKTTIEKLKQFRWQTLAILGVGWALFEKFF